MRTSLRVFLTFSFALICLRANAVPSFARQTGLTCSVCHRNPPELTAFGRNFKLRGYTLSSATSSEKVGNSNDLTLTRYIPASVMVLLSNTAYQSNQPASQNNAAGFPQQLSLFLAGGFAQHFGGFAQLTYTHSDDHFGMDNADLRFVNHMKFKGKDLDYGITLNNNPTVEDLWNSTPAWGFPWISTESGLGPIASPLINGGLAQDVAGAGAYGMWNNHLYTNVSVYRSEHAGAATPLTGTDFDINISGVAPYWRTAWQQNIGSNYFEVGSFGIYLNSVPDAASGLKNRYFDAAVDFQYSRPIRADQLDVHGSYIRENSNLSALYASGAASGALHHLNMTKLDAVYHWTHRYSAAGAIFSTTGDVDPLLYGAAPLTGSLNGSPGTSGYIAQFAFWPMQNIDINVNYTGYHKFNGSIVNYDGANRNASDNNTVYMALWFAF